MNEPVAPMGPGAPVASLTPAEPARPQLPPSALQFDRAELEGTPEVRQGPACAFCHAPLRSSYFDVNGRMACESCRMKIEEQFKKGLGMAGFLRAAGAGLGAAIAGSAIYYAVRALTGYEIGLISILVGFMVGKSVRWGARGRGGWVYQTLAMFLTYMAIVSTYVPMIAKAVFEQQAGNAILGVLEVFALAAAVPFLSGAENILGLVIIAFGLWQAWKLTRRPAIAILGPLNLGTAPSPAPSDS